MSLFLGAPHTDTYIYEDIETIYTIYTHLHRYTHTSPHTHTDNKHGLANCSKRNAQSGEKKYCSR